MAVMLCRQSGEAGGLFSRSDRMPLSRATVLFGITLLGACVGPPLPPQPGFAAGPGFAAFGEDEDACRHIGTAAIKVAQETDAPQNETLAARSYDQAYQRCMFEHGRARQMDQMAGAKDAEAPIGNVHSFEYPDAFYHIPYATPGYGYDGYSY